MKQALQPDKNRPAEGVKQPKWAVGKLDGAERRKQVDEDPDSVGAASVAAGALILSKVGRALRAYGRENEQDHLNCIIDEQLVTIGQFAR